MRQPMTKCSAMSATGQNRAAEARADQMADLTLVGRETAISLAELTALVGELQDRVAALEGKR